MSKKKVCLISSSGGHFEKLRILEKLEDEFEIFFVTEKTKYKTKQDVKYFVSQVNRNEFDFIFKMLFNFIYSLYIFLKERPDIIISTGALSVIPTFFIGKLFKKKLVFIESFAKIESPTKTGKLLYKFTDVFIVQWSEMKKIYPNAIYLGSIY